MPLNILSEEMRQQYLGVMGIQTWYDPLLEFEPENAQKPGDVSQETVQLENSTDTSVIQKQLDADVALQTILPANSVQINSLDEVTNSIQQCQLCELHTTCKQPICGEGNSEAELLIIIDAPINDAIDSGALFSIQDRKMLQAMLQSIGIELSSVYLTSLVKCKPPEQRAPYTSEMICCDDHLTAQIKLIQPKTIMVLGEQASRQLLVSQKSLTDLRLRHHQHLGVPVYASYHPQNMFNSSETKRKVWQDLLQISKQIKK